MVSRQNKMLTLVIVIEIRPVKTFDIYAYPKRSKESEKFKFKGSFLNRKRLHFLRVIL